jgi:hypothetical protein
MNRRFLALSLIAVSLGGCNSVKNLFGAGNDDTVLPGKREEVLPPESQTAQDPKVMGKEQAPPPADDCPADDPDCVPQVEDVPAPVE